MLSESWGQQPMARRLQIKIIQLATSYQIEAILQRMQLVDL